jgi:tripartite-type tricarboxylate transporter receptor subunit TctC
MGYEPLTDFAPVSLLTRNMVVLVVHPSVPATTLADYIALARAKPGELFYASSGVGGPNHLAGEIFNRMTGVNIVHVPFPGTGGAIQAVIGNQVGAMWGFMAGLIPHIRSGAVTALAVGGKVRSPAYPTCRRRRTRAFPATRHLLIVAARPRRPGGRHLYKRSTRHAGPSCGTRGSFNRSS